MNCPQCKKPMKFEDTETGKAERKKNPMLRVVKYCPSCKVMMCADLYLEDRLFYPCDPKTGRRLA